MTSRRPLGDGGAWDQPALSRHGADVAGSEPVGPDELGRGGGGVVRRGPDRHLPRQVAWKTVAGDSPALRARLLGEARALASLEHPGIIPIYDQVVGEGGELRLGLRIIRGDTLEARIRTAGDLDARLGLLRDALKAIEAIAWAHYQGWVHRDLKPANIMLGEFGEVQVIDWGLARRVDAPADPALEVPGVTLGTPAWMSPEQARGEAAGPPSDVWGLGATLFELVSGRPPFEGDPASVLRCVRVGRRKRVLEACPEVPAVLADVIERALAFHPEDRYPDARALADDVSAYLDGRRVHAHRYGPGERVADLVRRWRVPLGLALAGLVGVLIAGGVALVRLDAERERVAAAHSTAVAALAARDAEAVRAWVNEASAALDADRRPEAERAAARALAIGEDPGARGVLAAFGRAPRPRRVQSLPTGDCLDADVDPSGRIVLCGRKDELTLWRDGSKAWTLATPHRAAALTDGGAGVLVQRFEGPALLLDAADGRERGAALDPTYLGRVRGGPDARFAIIEDRTRAVTVDLAGARVWEPCGGSGGPIIQALAFDGTVRAALCGDGALVLGDADGERVVATPWVSPQREYVALALVPGGRAIVGTTRGVTALLDVDSGQVLAQRAAVPTRMVARVDVSPAGGVAVVSYIGGPVELIDAETLSPHHSLPRGERPLRWLGPRRLATAGDGVAVRDFPAGPIHRVGGLGSISGARAVGGLLSVARDEGAALIDAERGRVRLWVDRGRGVTKEVWAQGAALLIATVDSSRGPRDDVSAVDGWHLTAMFPARKLVALPDGAFVRSWSHPGLELWWGPGDAHALASAHVADLAAAGGWVAALESRPRRFVAYSFEATPAAVAACDDPGAIAVAIGPGGDDGVAVFTAHASAAYAWGLDCSIRTRYDLPSGELWRLAVSPDGAWVAAGTLAGEVVVWRRDGTLAAIAPVHSEAVTALVSDPAGRWFVSGSWDGQVRFFDLATVAREREELAAEVADAW